MRKIYSYYQNSKRLDGMKWLRELQLIREPRNPYYEICLLLKVIYMYLASYEKLK